MFFEDQHFLFIAKTDKETCYLAQCVYDIMRWLPDEIFPRLGINNDHLKEFIATKSSMKFGSANYFNSLSKSVRQGLLSLCFSSSFL